MRILITGSSGFIGRHLAARLAEAGHDLTCVVRHCEAHSVPGTCLEKDFATATHPQDWSAAVAGMDVVINAVGIFKESSTQTFDAIHRAAPCALFLAAAQAGVAHVVQISALGADDGAQSGFHRSKKAADDFLMALPGVRASIVQPSLVYGPGGASAALFETMASLPVIVVPGSGNQAVQPVHIDDLVSAVEALVRSGKACGRVAMVGPVALTLRQFLASLRAAMDVRGPVSYLPVPMPWLHRAARLGKRLPGAWPDEDALDMLERGNTAPAAGISSLLGRKPEAAERFIPASYAEAVRSHATMRWLLPVLRVCIGLVWLVTGIVSLGVYPVEDSYRLLARTGTPEWLQPVFLYGAALLDIALGAMTLWPYRPRWLWHMQAGLVLAYTLIITWKLPEFWAHPYGPVLKNLPFLAGLWILRELDRR